MSMPMSQRSAPIVIVRTVLRMNLCSKCHNHSCACSVIQGTTVRPRQHLGHLNINKASLHAARTVILQSTERIFHRHTDVEHSWRDNFHLLRTVTSQLHLNGRWLVMFEKYFYLGLLIPVLLVFTASGTFADLADMSHLEDDTREIAASIGYRSVDTKDNAKWYFMLMSLKYNFMKFGWTVLKIWLRVNRSFILPGANSSKKESQWYFISLLYQFCEDPMNFLAWNHQPIRWLCLIRYVLFELASNPRRGLMILINESGFSTWRRSNEWSLSYCPKPCSDQVAAS